LYRVNEGRRYQMKFRKLGRSGLKVSEISLGSWLTYGNSTEKETAIKTIDKAYELGIIRLIRLTYTQKARQKRLLGKR
jgi:CRISPR/Cas system-associated protein endoribonuclease Cas2